MQNKIKDMGFGLIVIAVGVVLLLNNLGIVPWSYWQEAWKYWPVLVILAGLSIINKKK